MVSTPFVRAVTDRSAEPAVQGFLHVPSEPNGNGLVLTHGAGANCESRLMVAVAEAFAATSFTVLRCDLPFRQQRLHGPPFPGSAVADRNGLRRAARVLQESAPGRIYLGGHSYGGRQASMLAAEEKGLVAGLLLLSYPLHPPRKPEALRVAHFPQLETPALFVHGSRDPFGSVEELRSALTLIPGRSLLLEIAGSGHDLLPRGYGAGLPARITETFQTFFG